MPSSRAWVSWVVVGTDSPEATPCWAGLGSAVGQKQAVCSLDLARGQGHHEILWLAGDLIRAGYLGLFGTRWSTLRGQKESQISAPVT